MAERKNSHTYIKTPNGAIHGTTILDSTHIFRISLASKWQISDIQNIQKIANSRLDIWVLIEAARNFYFCLVCQTSQFSIYKVTEHQVSNQYLKNWKIRDIIDTDEWHKICSLISKCTIRKIITYKIPHHNWWGPRRAFLFWVERVFFSFGVCNPPRVSNFTLIQIYWFEYFVVYR